MKKFSVGLMLTLALSACHHGGDKKMLNRRENADAFIKLVQESTGETYEVVKWYGKASNDFIVFKNVGTGEFIAVNLAKFDRKTMTSLDQYLSVIDSTADIVHNLELIQKWEETGYWEPITEYQCDIICSWVEVGSRWVDTSGWYSYYSKGDLVFDLKNSAVKDLELIASLAESASKKTLALSLQSQFSLSMDRSQELSDMLIKYRRLENLRELTDAEKSIFAEGATGSNFNAIEDALKEKSQGKEDAYKKLIEKAAQVNGTTPEKIGEFFDNYLSE